MTARLRRTWDDIAYHWDDWGPPLRPGPEDVRIMSAALGRWHARERREVVQALLCGTTPELATTSWPVPVRLLAVDKSEPMLRVVWPGDIPGARAAVVGDWLDLPIPARSRDVVLADGGFVFFDHPDGQRELLAALWRALRPGGLLVLRLFARAPGREPLAEVLRLAGAGRIGSFHAFKWRVAMALQPESRSGVRQHDVWAACRGAGLDVGSLPRPGWSARAANTIRFYRDQETRLYFPTIAEFRDLLRESFEDIEVALPDYELGERCPIFTARPRPLLASKAG
jgi:SAM-dependent methyltransferase